MGHMVVTDGNVFSSWIFCHKIDNGFIAQEAYFLHRTLLSEVMCYKNMRKKTYPPQKKTLNKNSRSKVFV